MRERYVKRLVLIAYGVGSVVAILAMLSVAVRIQDWIFRARAEHLFGDFQSVDPRRTTLQQANSIFERWHDSANNQLPCAKQDCEFGIGIAEPAEWHTSKLFLRMLSLYRFLGGHPAIALAEIKVTEGVVSSKRYSLSIEAPPVKDEEGRSLTYYVEGKVSMGVGLAKPRTTSHPEYEIGSNACLGCLEIHVSFTPSADPADVRRLSRIDFSCLTRQHPCRTKSEIMPDAALETVGD